ncbi:DNA replication complex GINS protein PSF2-like isoform X1 [Pistacia vera]|uniref:DNA replication complex GINS protein PSF2-like isoform X1 n=1 Tax=Pistacia vera TaxID=55513 RepID=UPI0012631041|nr:DNA replication complex GINS protein PSF2-like isoform X1 [Pistacia vera]
MAGQSDSPISLFSPEEVEFIAEDELMEIVPNMRMDPLNFICGDFGPFFPQIPVKVPLWLAVALKKRGKCTIRPPQWMTVENLTQLLEGEREDQGTFQAVPFHYIEISRLLFDHSAREDIPDIYMVRSLIEDIRDVRLHKVETNLEKFSATSAVKIAHLSAMEVNVVRPFVVRSLQAFYKHDNPVVTADLDSMSNRQPQVRQPQVPNNARRQPLKRR